MATSEVERPEDTETGVRVTCTDHGESAHFQPGQARVAFYCPDCEYEVEVTLHDALDGRPWGEKC